MSIAITKTAAVMDAILRMCDLIEGFGREGGDELISSHLGPVKSPTQEQIGVSILEGKLQVPPLRQ
jgi:hypothetical protein